MKIARLAVRCAALLALVSCLSSPAQPVPAPQAQAQAVSLPLVIEGSRFDAATLIYRPPGEGPFPLVIFSHGRAGSRPERLKLAVPLGPNNASYWTRKGVAVVATVRSGYGETGGTDWESNFVTWRAGACVGNPDYKSTAQHASAVVEATYRWALEQPWVRKDRILLVGQSVGGLGTVAASAMNLPGVVGAMNFAGGSGGNPGDSPGKSCKPEVVGEIYQDLGRQTRMPTIWFYAQNDQYWGPDVPRTWFELFKAGGSDATLVQTGPVEGHDGHQLMAWGSSLWHAQADAFVRKVGLTAP